jgi:ribonuclease J
LKAKSLFTISPLGGVGQIGSNMTMFTSGEDRFCIDAGILFPYEDFFDIDYLVPDLNSISPPKRLIITHGHEDHIGAIFYFLKNFPDVEVYASPFAAALIRKKLDYEKVSKSIHVFKYNETIETEEFLIDPISVNHSIPETFGLLIKHKKSNVVTFFASDFKIDKNNKYEKYFDFKKLIELSSRAERRLFLADSTNIMSKELNTPSEMELAPSFEKIFSEATDRIFITMFSSNVHRIHTILELAEKNQLKVAPHGRSMIGYINSAKDLGILPPFEKTLVSADSVSRDQKNVVILLSGCQGDFLGTFRRVSIGEDSQFKPRSTDTFIISSKAIPGNEKKIGLLLNKLAEIGVKIFSPSDLPLHVSGHPGKKDLLEVYNQFKPDHIIPIHGETQFIREHIALVKNQYPSAETHFALNFDHIHFLSDFTIKVENGERKDPIIVHGRHIPIEKEKISERRKLACNGCFFISLNLTSKHFQKDYHITHLGLPNFFDSKGDHFKVFLESQLMKFNRKNPEAGAEELRVSLRRYFDNILGYKPTTVVHLL